MEDTTKSVMRSGNLNPMFGKRHSTETKERISNTQKARYAAIRKAIHEREDILNYGDNDPQTRKEILRHLLDNNNLKFNSVKQAADFFVIMLGKDRIEESVYRTMDRYIAENCILRED